MEDNNGDDYINDDCIIEDENFLTFKPLIMCGLCNKILKKPKMCLKCQTNFCEKCIEKWSDDFEKCPKNCENPDYQPNKDKLAILSMIKFKCKNCKREIKYNDVESHLKLGCGKKQEEDRLCNIIYKKKKLKKLTNDEIKAVKEKGKEINHLTSKN